MKLLVCSGPIDNELVRRLPRQQVHECWHGRTLTPSFECCLAMDPFTLWCVWKVPGSAWCDESLAHGDFVEGLWNWDVAELFLSTGGESYREYNISPRGAWWCAQFDRYRCQCEVQSTHELPQLFTSIETGSWEAVLGIPRRELALDAPEHELAIHVAAITHRPESRFISSQPVAGVEPDFHRRECRGPMISLQLNLST
jgi:hypothetical protein